jgi:hypothetical protein
MANPLVDGHGPSMQSVYDVSTSKEFELGTRGTLRDGRVFYYAKHTLSTTFTRGSLLTQAAVVANHQNRTVTAVAGQFTATIAIGATAMTAGQYEDGYLFIDSSTLGIGQARKVKRNGASAGSTTETIDLYDFWRVTATGTITGSLQKNLYADLVVHPGNAILAGCPVGVPAVAVPAGDTTAQYFWIQTQGWAVVNCEGSVTAGQTLSAATAATTDAGQFKLAAGATTADDHVLALVIAPNGTDEHFALADLCIRG